MKRLFIACLSVTLSLISAYAAPKTETISLDAYPDLVENAIFDYDLEKAQDLIEKWRAALKKAKKTEPSEINDYEQAITMMNNQLERVEDVPVIARYDISRKLFDTALDKLNQGGAERGKLMLQGNIPFYVNNMSREVFWTQPDENGVNRLFTAGVLDDGTREEPRELTEYVGEGDIKAPFMLEDGETLYFAADMGEGMSGYDIYMTRRDGEGGFYEPSNIGMPYNSPADELLFVIDERNNIGWWVTDRFDTEDSVSVMVFVPNATRVNVDSDDEDLVQRASLSDIDVTIPKGFNLADAKARIQKPGAETDMKQNSTSAFALSLGDGRVVTSTSQFKNREAGNTMSEVLRTTRILDDTVARLDSMRRAYADGDKSLKNDILTLEKEVDRKRTELKNLTNRVIKLETNGR